jgi:cation:H+ antiporter
MDGWTLMRFGAGLALLVGGAEALVRGASRLAVLAGIAPLVVGLTVVAYGTSAPEVAVSIGGALGGQPDISIGNALGSNVFNVLFILGLSALIAPLTVAPQLLRFDVPVMIAAAFLLLGLAADGRLGRIDGGLLCAAAVAYTAFVIQQGRRQGAAVRKEYEREFGGGRMPRSALQITANFGLIVLGIGLLVLGARWLVDSAVVMARAAGVDELVIGLTVVAAGTSLPEAATSITAARRGERDIAVGNVVGSNIFNVLVVLGLTALVAPAGVPVSHAVLWFDLPVMIAVCVACLPVFFTGHRIARWEGLLFLAYYGLYTSYLVLRVGEHAALATLNAVTLEFVLPLTAVTLLVVVWRFLRSR